MKVRNNAEVKIVREGGKLLGNILRQVAEEAKPGTTAASLNEKAEALIRHAGATPSFLGYTVRGAPIPYPAVLCVSVNDEVVHAIPSVSRVLREGDIVGLDLGLWLKGLCVDAAVTVGVGKISGAAKKLIDTARNALKEGVAAAKAGGCTGDIGYAVQTYVEGRGFSVVRDLAGHGVGRKVHEDPIVLNFGKKGRGEPLEDGMVIAIEPMVNEGDWHVKIDEDGWTIRTADGKLSAHFEHTVLVTKEGCEILTE